MKIGDMVIKRFAKRKLYQVVSMPIRMEFFRITLTYYECRHNDSLFIIWDKRLKKVEL